MSTYSYNKAMLLNRDLYKVFNFLSYQLYVKL